MLKGFLAYLIVSNDETSISTSKASSAKSRIEFYNSHKYIVAKTCSNRSELLLQYYTNRDYAKGLFGSSIMSNKATSISTSKASSAKSCIEFRDPQMQSVAKTREFLHPTVFSCLCQLAHAMVEPLMKFFNWVRQNQIEFLQKKLAWSKELLIILLVQ